MITHLAAESHVDRSIDGPGTFVQTNVVGTFTLLSAARAYWQELPSAQRTAFRFHHISTDEVFGSLGDTGLFSEDTPYDPRSPYSASKAASDHLVSALGHTYGLPVLITNCSNNYGPYRSYAGQIGFVADRPGHDLRYAIDAMRIRDELGWTPQESFESGLEATVRWYLANEDWWRPLVAGQAAAQRRGLVA